jgi:hypothetical protein
MKLTQFGTEAKRTKSKKEAFKELFKEYTNVIVFIFFLLVGAIESCERIVK